MNNYFTNEFSKEIWETKYKAPNIDNTIEDTWNRISNYLVSLDKKYYNKDKEFLKQEKKEFYSILEKFNTLGGRILSNAGLNKQGLSLYNCFIFTPPPKDLPEEIYKYGIDSIQAIMYVASQTALILKSEGGNGLNLPYRPRGSFINGILSETPGSIVIAELFDKISEVITRGNNQIKGKNTKKSIRKGALMLTLFVDSPDIEEFIEAKRTPNRLSKFNLSILITDEFMNAVIHDKDFDLWFPDTSWEKYNELWDGDYTAWKKNKYPLIVYKTIKAKELYNKIMKSNYDYGEPGVLFIDRINQLDPYANKDYSILTTNPCLPDFVEFITTTGLKQFKDIKIGDQIVSKEGWTTVIKKWATGIKKVYKYHTSSGYLASTDNHRIVENGKKIEIKKAKSLTKLRFKNTNLNSIIDNTEDIIKVEYIGELPVWDLTVDNNSHTFWCNGFDVSNCGEVPNSSGGICNLGSLNLVNYIDIEKKDWKYKEFEKDCSTHIRMLDLVNDSKSEPLKDNTRDIENYRRIGQGILGYGSALYLLGLTYGSEEALKKTEKLLRLWLNTAYRNSSLLAKEKGKHKKFNYDSIKDNTYFKLLDNDVKELVKKYGVRNSQLISIAPTGSTSLLCNNVSGGIEPLFMHEYIRISIIQNKPEGLTTYRKEEINFQDKPDIYKGYDNTNWKWIKEGNDWNLKIKYKNIVYRIDQNRGLTKETLIEDYAVKKLKELNTWNPKEKWAVTTTTLDINAHLNTLKLFSKYVTQSISKTVNIPRNYAFNNLKELYINAWKTKTLKGLTVYREGSLSGVLISKDKVETVLDSSYIFSIESFEKEKKNINSEEEHIIRTDLKLPQQSLLERFTIKAEGKKWHVFVDYFDKKYAEKYGFGTFRPFAIWVKTNHKEKYIEIKKVVDSLFQLAINKGIDIKIINKLKEDIKLVDTIDKFTRTLALCLRHGIAIHNITDTIDREEAVIGSLIYHLNKFLKKFQDGKNVNGELCPECNSKLIYESGCVVCKQCGWSKCS